MVSGNLFIRSLSSILICAVVSLSLYFGGIAFYILCFFLAMVSSVELFNIMQCRRLYYIPAFFMIVIPYASLVYIYNLLHGEIILIWLIFVIWGTDVAAYFVGKNIGEKKIVPMISPNKTWAGLFGGIVAGAFISVVISVIFGIFFVFHAFIAGILIAFVAQVGDITESYVKRLCKVKDSGSFIPGHGGILDRMDSFIFTAPLVAYYVQKFSKFFLA
ncbi:cytidylyltransferase family protein [Ehrlichia chaffeensis str. Heartland]|uniref:phosphatidate cytidylyltransferase n=1 Tax=Ehrlichia chaffeensis TaxID=945 RepID=UPI000053DD5E|nr:CDP-archaeol synthase [Ehrlichia chaffeensis]AHX03390.1 cytidylyltransferase family protein [Ehrlichia chaffeensis str. Heartland]AHX05889.1 cytidylyltransferase family protein [Ehrlichia chaffeensis str. Jax]AHX06881.1 cytidylyltransferase family protein [Ehrlichia chaffeensis str. Liberty]AHX07719.1 cytidylyltransferase family protein [Ehrlichia chaffeensis str. Osceola]AHX08494.1 cytidylyltransferase family protein [Ehrlichia chaffeensis str. Saint Vincent]